MPVAGEKQRHTPPRLRRHNAGSEDAFAFRRVACFSVSLLLQTQHRHRSIIVVLHFPSRRLADELLQRRLNYRRSCRRYFPLRRGRQRDLQARLQILQPVEGQPTAIFQQCQHTGGGGVILLRSHSRRRLGREDFSAQVAAQILQVIDGGR